MKRTIITLTFIAAFCITATSRACDGIDAGSSDIQITEYACNIGLCKFTAVNEQLYIRHQSSHRTGSLFCDYCNYTTDRQTDLEIHHNRHLGNKPFPCLYENCIQAFCTEGELNRHAKTHIADNKTFACPHCSHTTTTGAYLDLHIKTHNEDKPHRCPIESCLKGYARNSDLVIHIRTHTGERPFPCTYEDCTQAFPSNSALSAHMNRHNAVKPCKCTHEGCDKTFATNSDLAKHTKTHTGERPFPCTYATCTKAFSSSGDLVIHIRTHTGEKPYKCTYETCTKAFASSTKLTRHRKIHTKAPGAKRQRT